MNKRWLIAAIVLPFLGGCSSENDIPGKEEDPKEIEEYPISLSASMNTATRAEVDQAATDSLRKFWVYGWKTVRGEDVEMMAKQEVNRTDKDAPWTYSPLRYWDMTASKYMFVGYESSDPLTNVKVKDGKLTFTNIPQWQLFSYSYTTSDATKKIDKSSTETLSNATTKDYMISRSTDTPANYLAATNPGVVHLSFYHLLSKLNIKAFCEVNDAATKYVIEKIVLSSFPSSTALTDTYQEGVPNAENTLSEYTFDYKKEIPTGGTILSNTAYSEFTKIYSIDPSITKPTNQSDVDLYPVDGKGLAESTKYLLPSSEKDEPTPVSSWIVAPFDLAQVYKDNTSATDPCLALKVIYDARVYDETQHKYNYTQYVSKWIKVTDSSGNLLTKFEPNTEYTWVLDVRSGSLAVLLDVAILPWVEKPTQASPHAVHNW